MPSRVFTWRMAISVSALRGPPPMAPVAGSMYAHSEEPAQKAPSHTSWASTTPAKSVARPWVMEPAMVNGVAWPPMERVPTLVGTPHSAARMT